MNLNLLRDVGERALWTGLQVLGAAQVAPGVDWALTLQLAAYAALGAVLKGLVASRVGEKGTAATLPSPHGG